MHSGHCSLTNSPVRRTSSIGFTTLALGLAALAITSPAQAQRLGDVTKTQVIVAPEPGIQRNERFEGRLPRSLPWEDKRQALLAAGVAAPPTPPSEFALTPREPWRSPGGYLNVDTRVWWMSGRGTGSAHTGFITIQGSGGGVAIRLRGLRPNTNYLVDLSISSIRSGDKLTVKDLCGYRGTTIGQFSTNGSSQHVFVVAPTDSSGSGGICPHADRGGLTFYKAEITELGSAP
ncbi:MAG: hypothetical protein ACODAA_09255 [Gemmatimonadota bacterium]